ncbi:hypothetical protein Bca4012_003124 [Brassica carinata]
MGAMKTRSASAGRWVNEVVSFVVFCLLDIMDYLLCLLYKTADYLLEAEWKPCYCLSPKKLITASRGNILLSHNNCESKILTVSPLQQLSGRSKIELEEISETLYSRPSLLSDLSKLSVNDLTKWVVNMTRSHSDCGEIKISNSGNEDVLFIHGFISSSAFWTETVFPRLSTSKYRLFAVDLLGFGKSPKPADSLYTMREHVEMIEKSVLLKHNVKSFHIVAHSLGCILAFGLVAKHGGSIKSLTLLAPPYHPVPTTEAEPRQYVMKKVAPRRIWPPIAFGASMACWTVNFLIEGFMCHTHNAAWHTLHNIICGVGSKLDSYLDIVRDKLKCNVAIFHGRDDEVVPVECSYNVQSRIPRARVKVIENKDHITLVVGRQVEFAKELEEIWKSSSC